MGDASLARRLYTMYTGYTFLVITKTNAEGAVIPLRLSGELVQKLDRAVDLMRYRSRSELMREALEQYVDQIANAKLVDVRDVSVEEAARLIDERVSKHPGVHHVSELAEVLGIELSVAFRAVQSLVRDKKVRVRK